MADIVRLRGHHLLCMLSYIGRGYTPDFTGNFDAIAGRLNQGAVIELTEGPDDICASLQKPSDTPCPHASHCLESSSAARDVKALEEVSALLGKDLNAGERFGLSRTIVACLRRAFATGAIRNACQTCQWHSLCTDIAANRFDRVKLYPHACR